MDLSKKTNLAKARKNVQEKKAREERDLRHATKEQFEAFIGDLGAVLAQGVRVEGLGDVDSIVCRIEAYGQDIADLVGRIVECTAAIPNLDELRLPDTIELKTVTDPKLLDALEKVGDDGLLLEKFKALDETLILLSDAISKDQSPGQTEEDFQPVRIVLGREGSLKFLENWPTPVFSSGGGSGGTSGGLTDAELRASPVPVSATISTAGLATDTKQDTGNASLASIDGKITAVNTGAVTVASSALPTGAATAANQQTNALTDAQLRATAVPVSGTVTATPSGTQNVDVTANTIGLATSAKQDTLIGHVDGLETSTSSIDGKTPALGQALAAASTPVVLTAAQEAALTPPAAITGFATETTLGTRLTESDFDTKTGSLTETAPATDTASSGLNGRLQRIAQRLTSLIALLPGSLGQKARAASFAVTLSTEDVTALTPPAAITGFGTSANQTTIIGHVDGIEASVDGIETLIGTTNSTLTTIAGHVDQIEGYVDGIETAIASTNTKLDSEIVNSAAIAASASVLDDWDESDRAKVNLIVGQAGVAAAAGTVSAATQRIVRGTGSTSTQTQVADSASSQTILAANTGRIRATIVNDSTEILYLRESSSAATTTAYTWKVPAGATVIIDDYNGALTGIWAANGSGQATVSEVTA